MLAAIRVSISDVDFWRRNNLDFVWQRVVTFSWQSRWTFILHKRHFRPCLVCPENYKFDIEIPSSRLDKFIIEKRENYIH